MAARRLKNAVAENRMEINKKVIVPRLIQVREASENNRFDSSNVDLDTFSQETYRASASKKDGNIEIPSSSKTCNAAKFQRDHQAAKYESKISEDITEPPRLENIIKSKNILQHNIESPSKTQDNTEPNVQLNNTETPKVSQKQKTNKNKTTLYTLNLCSRNTKMEEKEKDKIPKTKKSKFFKSLRLRNKAQTNEGIDTPDIVKQKPNSKFKRFLNFFKKKDNNKSNKSKDTVNLSANVVKKTIANPSVSTGGTCDLSIHSVSNASISTYISGNTERITREIDEISNPIKSKLVVVEPADPNRSITLILDTDIEALKERSDSVSTIGWGTPYRLTRVETFYSQDHRHKLTDKDTISISDTTMEYNTRKRGPSHSPMEMCHPQINSSLSNLSDGAEFDHPSHNFIGDNVMSNEVIESSELKENLSGIECDNLNCTTKDLVGTKSTTTVSFNHDLTRETHCQQHPNIQIQPESVEISSGIGETDTCGVKEAWPENSGIPFDVPQMPAHKHPDNNDCMSEHSDYVSDHDFEMDEDDDEIEAIIAASLKEKIEDKSMKRDIPRDGEYLKFLPRTPTPAPVRVLKTSMGGVYFSIGSFDVHRSATPLNVKNYEERKEKIEGANKYKPPVTLADKLKFEQAEQRKIEFQQDRMRPFSVRQQRAGRVLVDLNKLEEERRKAQDEHMSQKHKVAANNRSQQKQNRKVRFNIVNEKTAQTTARKQARQQQLGEQLEEKMVQQSTRKNGTLDAKKEKLRVKNNLVQERKIQKRNQGTGDISDVPPPPPPVPNLNFRHGAGFKAKAKSATVAKTSSKIPKSQSDDLPPDKALVVELPPTPIPAAPNYDFRQGAGFKSGGTKQKASSNTRANGTSGNVPLKIDVTTTDNKADMAGKLQSVKPLETSV